MRLQLIALIAGIGTIPAATPASAAPATCASLRSMSIPNVTISAAELVSPPASPGRGAPTAPTTPPGAGAGRAAPAGPAAPALPEYCRVRLLLTPSSDSHINAELWLPSTTWNGRFMAVGNGGFGGSIQGFGEMQNALRLGYATSGNDTGHDTEVDGPNESSPSAIGKIVDFACAPYEMTATSRRSSSSSTAGRSVHATRAARRRQGAMNAQRYPRFRRHHRRALANRHIQYTAGVARSIELARQPTANFAATAQMVTQAVLRRATP